MTTLLEMPSHHDVDGARWRAVMRRDRRADGAFVFAVKTTGVYCRPSCASRRALRANVEFYATPADAEGAGFRACKRCRPDITMTAQRDDHAAAVVAACRQLAQSDAEPDLASLAAAAGMSPSHFHRVFKLQTGLTPKAYALAHRAGKMRDALSRKRGNLTTAIYDAGFNSSGRFYTDAPLSLGMSPAAFRAGGAGETIRFAVSNSTLGSILVAASQRGVCAIALGDDPDELVSYLKHRFPAAESLRGDAAFERLVKTVIRFVDRPELGLNLPLDVRGTAFQHRVWRKLREIPSGETRTYAQLAADLDTPRAVRAVARACGANPVAVAIPCHRVIGSNGSLTGYRWGVERKAKLLKREQRRT